jgi:hypothetical protein
MLHWLQQNSLSWSSVAVREILHVAHQDVDAEAQALWVQYSVHARGMMDAGIASRKRRGRDWW